MLTIVLTIVVVLRSQPATDTFFLEGRFVWHGSSASLPLSRDFLFFLLSLSFLSFSSFSTCFFVFFYFSRYKRVEHLLSTKRTSDEIIVRKRFCFDPFSHPIPSPLFATGRMWLALSQVADAAGGEAGDSAGAHSGQGREPREPRVPRAGTRRSKRLRGEPPSPCTRHSKRLRGEPPSPCERRSARSSSIGGPDPPRYPELPRHLCWRSLLHVLSPFKRWYCE